MKLTQEEIEAIRKRAEAATPGPWVVGAVPDVVFVETNQSELILEKESDKTQDYNTAEFIAHAREDVPKLVAEIERLRKLAHEILEDYDNAERNLIGHFARNYDKEIASQSEYVAEYLRQIHGVDFDD
jgi:hypothetical protein